MSLSTLRIVRFSLLALAVLAATLAIALAADTGAKEGDIVLGLSYAEAASPEHFDQRAEAYGLSLESNLTDRVTVEAQGDRLSDQGFRAYLYNIGGSVSFFDGSFSVPFGLSAFQPDRGPDDLVYGGNVGLRGNFWAGRHVGIRLEAKYHFLERTAVLRDRGLVAGRVGLVLRF